MEMTQQVPVDPAALNLVAAVVINHPALLALYPIITILTLFAAILCLIGAWRSRSDRMPLWFVLVGMILTKIGLSMESVEILIHRMSGTRFDIPLVQLILIKIAYIVGTSFQIWGVMLSIVTLSESKRKLGLVNFAVTIVALYAAFLALFAYT